MTDSLPTLQCGSNRKATFTLYLVILLGVLNGISQIGISPLSAILLTVLPICALATLRGLDDFPILVLISIAGSIGIIANVATGVRSPAVLAWLLFAPVVASQYIKKRQLLLIAVVAALTFLGIAILIPGDTPTSWTELRSQFALILVGSVVVGWFNIKRVTTWQEEAQEVVQGFDSVVDSHPLGAIVLVDGSIETVNQMACRTLHMSRDDLIGARVDKVLPFDLSAGERSTAVLNADGKTRTIEVRQRKVDLPKGSGTILVLSDQTESLDKQREDRKMLIRRQDKERLELVGRLAGGVAHDFNNLLATIFLNVDLARLANDRGDTDGCQEFHDEIAKAGESARDLVAQLLAYSGRGPVVREIVDVGSRLASMVELLQGTAKTSQVELRIETAKPVAIEADPTHIGQVLMNLATNAIEACGDNGVVELAFHETYLEPQSVLGKMVSPNFQEGRFLEISVRDNGRVLTNDQLRYIFEPYHSTFESRSGLGLAAVKGIIFSQGGVLELESKPGIGTLLRAFMPVTNSGQQRLPTADIRARVLVVDDDPAVTSILCRRLDQAGFRTKCAENLRQAREIVNRDPMISIVLSDYNLPDGTGLDLKVDPEDDQQTLDVPLVLMSSYQLEDLENLEDTPLLSKPFDFNQVVKTLESELKKHRRRTAGAA